MNKAIYYFSLAANQGNREAQFNLGIFYYLRDNNLDIKKGRYYIMLSSKNGNKQANFSQGFMHHEGKNLERNIQEAISFYKEASSFNNQYAKNNLGVIFKNGFEDKIKKQSANAVIFFEEAIRQKKKIIYQCTIWHIFIYMMIQLKETLINQLSY